MALPLWEDGPDFARLLSSFEAVLPLREPSGLGDDPTLRHHILDASGGMIGEMSAMLAAAARQALTTGHERIDRMFYKHVLGCPAGEPMEMNAYPPTDMLERLEAGTGVPIEWMRDMTTDRMMARTIAELRQTVMIGPEPVPQPPSRVAGLRRFVDGV